MITKILQTIEMITKIKKVKTIIDFLKKHIPSIFHIYILYLAVFFLFCDRQNLQNRVANLEKANRINLLRNVSRFSNNKIKLKATEKAKKQNQIYYLYQDIDVFDSQDKVQNITVLRNLFCKNGKDENCIESENLQHLLNDLKQPLYTNDTKKWFNILNRKKINLIYGEDVWVYCGVFELKKYTKIETILNHIKQADKMFGFGCRFEDIHGVGFISEQNLSLNHLSEESFFNEYFQDFFDIWKAQYEYEIKMQKRKEKASY